MDGSRSFSKELECPETDSLNAEVGENLGFGFIDGEQVVAGGAILGNACAVLGRVAAVVAAEAAGIVHVANMVGVCSPFDLHIGKHVLAVEGYQLIAGGLDLRSFAGQNFRMLSL